MLTAIRPSNVFPAGPGPGQASVPIYGLHGVRRGRFVFKRVRRFIPGRRIRSAGSDRWATVAFLLAGDEISGGAKDGVQAVVDCGFDVDGIRGCAGVDEGDEDAETDAEHDRARALEVGRGFTCCVEGFLALSLEIQYAG